MRSGRASFVVSVFHGNPPAVRGVGDPRLMGPKTRRRAHASSERVVPKTVLHPTGFGVGYSGMGERGLFRASSAKPCFAREHKPPIRAPASRSPHGVSSRRVLFSVSCDKPLPKEHRPRPPATLERRRQEAAAWGCHPRMCPPCPLARPLCESGPHPAPQGNAPGLACLVRAGPWNERN